MSKLVKTLCEEFGIPDVGAPKAMNSVETVNTKIERAQKTEEVDTVAFGLETDDGRIIKVYVKAEQAEDFEQALSKELGVEDVIEDVLNKLSKDFDIIDVEWPDQSSDSEETEEDDELSVDDVDLDDEDQESDGSESMNKKVWSVKSGREKTKHLVKKENDMSYGQLFTKKLLGEMGLEEGKRFVTVIKGKEKVFMAFDEKTANSMAKRWGGEPVKPFKGHNTGGAKKKVAESSEINSVDDIVDRFGKDRIVKWLNNGNDDELRDCLYDYYANNGQMPYGTVKARDGDPDNWIADHFPDELADAGYIDGKTHKWIAEGKYDNLNPGWMKNPNTEEPEFAKQPGGKRYKVGLLDSRFSTVYQFMVYQALLDLGIPDEALNRAPQKNAIVMSIRNTAKELSQDPVRRQALRFLINRLKETTDVAEAKEDDKSAEKVSDTEKKEADKIKVGVLDDRFVTVIQKLLYQTILMLGLPDSFMYKSSFKNTIINSIKNKAKEIQKDSVKRSALRIFTHRFAEVKENLNENLGSDTVEFIANLLNKLVPEDKTDLVSKLEDTSAWQQVKRAIASNTKVNQTVGPIRQNLISISKKMAGNATFQEHLEEAKWGEESMLDDPEDQPVDKDTKVKLPKRKKDKRVGEEAEWEIKKNKKTGDLTLKTESFTVTLDDEAAEKLIKAFANKSIVILPDADISGTKWVFSPRARTYLVKQSGQAPAVKPIVLSWEDTNSVEDIYLGK